MSTESKEGTESPREVRQSQAMPLPDQQQHKIDEFWRRHQEEIDEIVDLKEDTLSLACLAEVLRYEHGTMMMSSDTLMFLAKLCELFIQELTFRAWICATSHDRDTILDSDIVEVVASTGYYDFLTNVLHRHGFGVRIREPCGIDLDKESMSSNAPQPFQEGPSLIAASSSVMTSSIGLEGAIPNRYEEQYPKEEGAVDENHETIVVNKGSEIDSCEGGNKYDISSRDDEIVDESTFYNLMEENSENPLLPTANHDISASAQPDSDESISDVDIHKISTMPNNTTASSK
ncbi:hypothetical protein ACP70R_024387 [Stipagrostis hirtigluma subsp. patula]